MKLVLISAALAAAAVFHAGNANAGGYDFRNFDSNKPRVGDKAPMPEGFDESGKRTGLASLIDGNHLVVVFGALT